MANISNTKANTLISGTSSDDTITNSGKNVTIDGGRGYDILTGSTKYGDVFRFSLEEDYEWDRITNFDAKDTLYIANGSITTYYPDGEDMVFRIQNSGNSGRIYLTNAASTAINLKVGDNPIEIINTMTTKKNSKASAVVNGTSGRDSISNTGKNATINGGDGYDTITNKGNGVSIFGGAGDDLIKSTGGSNVTLHGGEGDDTLTGSSKADVFEFRADGDYDVITNFGTNDTLYITSGAIGAFYAYGDTRYISVYDADHSEWNSGEIQLDNAANKSIKVKVGSNKVQTFKISDNSSYETVISGTKSVDYISNMGDDVTINAGAGNDFITNYYGENVSINAGAGNDFIGGYFSYTTVKGGAGNDTIYNGRDWYTNNVYQFSATEGNDLIQGFTEDDTLQITSGTLGTHYAVGDDYIVSVKGSKSNGVVTLQGAASTTIQIRNSKGKISSVNTVNNITNYSDSTIISGTAGRDSIYNRGDTVSIDAGAGNDTISDYGSYVTLNGGAGNDYIDGGYQTTYLFGASGGNDTISYFSEYDTLRITDGSIASHYADADDYIIEVSNKNSTGTIRVGIYNNTPITVIDTKGKLSLINYSKWNFASETAINGTKNADQIYNDGDDVSINAGAGNDFIYNSGGYVSINAGAGNDSIYSNVGYVSINAGAGNDSIGSVYFSTIRGGAGNDTVRYMTNSIYQIGSSDGNNLIQYWSAHDTLQLLDGSISSHSANGSDYIVNIKGKTNTASITLQSNAANTPIFVRDTKGKLSSLNYSITNIKDNTLINGTTKADKIANTGDDVTIQAGNGSDTIFNAGYYATINAGAGNDTVFNTFYGASIDGGAGNDYIDNTGYRATINGGKGNDTIEGSSYGNISVYQFGSDGGSDLITGFGEDDTLQIVSGSITSHYNSGADYIVEVGSAKITLGSVGSSSINVINADGSQTTFINDYYDDDDADADADADGDADYDELPSSEYWFEQDDPLAESPLDQILAPDSPTDLNFEQFAETFKPKLELVTSARHRAKK